MSKTNWLRYVAIGVCLIALLLAGSANAQAISDDTGSQPDTEQTQTAPENHFEPPARTVLDAIQSDIARVAAALEGIRTQGDAKDKEEREQSDLNAQWEMAYWAKWMFCATAIQALLTGLGLFAIWRTLHWTKQAVMEAGRATSAANAAVEITAKSARLQLRAYVLVKQTDFNIKIGSIPKITVILHNSGTTPAYDVNIAAANGFMEYPVNVPFPTFTDKVKSSYPIPPDGPFHLPVDFDTEINAKTMAAMSAGTHAIFIVGRVKYKDAFGESHETKFCLFYGGPIGTARGFAPYTEGNSAT